MSSRLYKWPELQSPHVSEEGAGLQPKPVDLMPRVLSLNVMTTGATSYPGPLGTL